MAKKVTTVRKGKARSAKDAADSGVEFEVEEETEVVVKPAMGIETALIAVTLVALVAAFVLVQLKMHSAFGKGWPF
jgi:hypothetical protein